MAALSHRSAHAMRIAPMALALTLTLAACVNAPDAPRPIARSAPASRLTPPPARLPGQCVADLARAQVRYAALPDTDFGGGCSAIDSVKLLDIGTPVTNLGAMTCPLAARFAAWARYGAQPAARLILGSDIARIETFGTYNCRPIAGSGKLSEHAHSNAVDVSAFILADGRRVSVLGDWRGNGEAARFLRIVRDSACKRFSTVLSPDYNGAHANHLHFDMGGDRRFCR